MTDPKTHRRDFLRHAAFAGFALSAAGRSAPAATEEGNAEWRNKQSGMAYRRLGRTGLMVSEVLSGGDPIRSGNWDHLNLALDKGLNYLDMAPAYGNGDCELSYGKLLAGRSSLRDKVFMTTKASSYVPLRNQMYKEIFDGLPGDKQREILQRSQEMIAERGIAKPGYFLTYFPGQMNQLPPVFLSNAMMQDYRHKVEGSPRFQQTIDETLEASLRRAGTDHFDIMMCPHGACSPDELESPEINEAFQKLKKQGKVRFLGVTSHNDPAGVLRKATELGHYDVVMMAYNVINGGYLEEPIRQAAAKGVGVIAMKVAMSVATHHKALQPVPQWRIDKVNRIVPGDMKPPLKAYTWALQNPNISAVISNLWDKTFIEENLSVAGKKVELQSA